MPRAVSAAQCDQSREQKANWHYKEGKKWRSGRGKKSMVQHSEKLVNLLSVHSLNAHNLPLCHYVQSAKKNVTFISQSFLEPRSTSNRKAPTLRRGMTLQVGRILIVIWIPFKWRRERGEAQQEEVHEPRLPSAIKNLDGAQWVVMEEGRISHLHNFSPSPSPSRMGGWRNHPLPA